MNRRDVLISLLLACAGRAAAVGPTDLATLSIAQLREDFNKASGKVRALTILSPT